MTEPITAAALKGAEVLAPDLVKAGARWTGRRILGTPAERGMRSVYVRAMTGLLAEVGGADGGAGVAPDPEAMKVAESVLEDLCSDEEAAGLLLDVALRPGNVPVEALRERAVVLGCEPGTLPFVFDGAMRVLVDKVWEEFLAEAGKENSPIQPLVNAELLIAMREQRQALREASTAERVSLLPPPPGLVLGRDDELRRAKRALGVDVRNEPAVGRGSAAQTRRVAAVHGWPGVGKSTFVAALCRDREVLERFARGVLFVPVGPSPDVRRLAGGVCAALGAPAPPGAPLDFMRGRISDALSRTPTLVVFDDVWEEGHVAPLLLAGGPSAALVATRRLDVAARLSTGPEGPLRLGLLSEDDSLELIASRAPGVVAEHGGACREMARALDGLPLALRVAADLLRVESEAGLDVSGLLAELTGAARVLGEEAPQDAEAEGAARTVRALLQKSVERLAGDAARRFARLGVLPPKPLSFDPWAAGDVWRDAPRDPEQEDDESEEEQAGARRALGELVRRGLVESAAFDVDPLAVKLDLRSKRPERFWTHALVSAFALETLEGAEGEGGVLEAQRRRLEHYRWVVLAANEAAGLGGDNQYLGVLLLSLDLPNIRAAHGWARARSSNDRQALEYLTRLPAAGRRVLLERLAPDEFLDWLTLAEESARAIGDEDEARAHRKAAGAALLMKGQLREALSYCEDSFRAAEARGDAVGMATALANRASVRNVMGAHDDALDLARRAETALGDADAPDVLLGAIGQQAEALEGLGRIAEAEERYEARRDLARSEGELSYYARALRGLARIKRERPEERDEARGMYDEAARVFRDLRDHWGYRGALNGKGALEIEAGSLDAAEELFGRALASAVDDEHEGDQARAKMNLAIAQQNRGTRQGNEAAEGEYREAVTLASGWDESDLLGDVLFNLAQFFFYLAGRPRDARAGAVTAAEAYRRAGSAKESWARDLISEIDDAVG